MFEKLFAERGFSLDRLRALLEVGVAGSIAKAAGGDPVRQSQYSRQIKELEDFFRTRLVERQGKGTRLTASGRELARISRFFMLGLSNFKRGCIAEEQTFGIGGSATFMRHFLMPALAGSCSRQDGARYAGEVAAEGEIERRLHDLTLDFGIVSHAELSRPLQTAVLGRWKLQLWVPGAFRLSPARALQAFERGSLPLVLARELEPFGIAATTRSGARLICDSFLDCLVALEGQTVAAVMPAFLEPKNQRSYVRVELARRDSPDIGYFLAWNPRLLRLNPHAVRRRDWLVKTLKCSVPGSG